MRKTLLILGALATLASPLAARAATTDVRIAGYQYVPSGYIALDPLQITGGPLHATAPSGALEAPTVHVGDTIAFANLDPFAHNMKEIAGPSRRYFNVKVEPLATASISITSFFAAGTYVYVCDIHPGMRGAFKVA